MAADERRIGTIRQRKKARNERDDDNRRGVRPPLLRGVFTSPPYETYARMRDEAPVYYSAEFDFYALTRHEDVAAAFKDHQTFSSAYGVDLAMVRKGEVTEHGSIIAMDPPEHRRMRSLLNKVFTPRAIKAHEPLVRSLIDKHLDAVNPDRFDVVQDFSALFPVDVMTTLQGVPEQDHQQIRVWIDELLHREPGDVDMTESGRKAAVDMAVYYYRLVKQRRNELGDDLLSQLITAEIERDNGEMAPAREHRNHRIRNTVRRRGRGDGNQTARQRSRGLRSEP